MKQYKSSDKTMLKMTREGAVEVNAATGKKKRISKRIRDADFAKTEAPQPPEQAAQPLPGGTAPAPTADAPPLPHAPGAEREQDTAAAERVLERIDGARLLFATAEPHIYEAVTAVFSCAGTDFTAKGKTVLSDGWKEIERRYRATLKDKPEAEDGENEGVTLPELSEGQNFPNPAAKVTEHTTTPPKPHSEASLLSAMERAGNGDTDPDAERRGLGTPATRAAVIEKLVKGGFAERKGKQLIPTQNGAALISVLPDMLTSPQLTAEWENNLTQIAKGAADPGEFLSGIEAMARELVQTHTAALDGKKDLFREEKPSVGKCPRCGSPVHEGKKNYYCSNKECAFVMWKNDRFFEERKTAFSAKIAAALLKSGKANVKKLYSPKTGKTYDGTIVLADTGGKYVNYRIEVQKN